VSFVVEVLVWSAAAGVLVSAGLAEAWAVGVLVEPVEALVSVELEV